MKVKTTVLVFSIIALALVIFSGINFFFLKDNKQKKYGQDVNIKISDSGESSSPDDSSLSSDVSNTTFVPLLSSETLISTLNVDFDGDTRDDQIVAVYKAGSEFLFLIVGLYNPDTNAYDRIAEIKTEITKTRTFSFSTLDMVGEHKMALLYQGIKNNGDSVMKIYHCNRKLRTVELVLIGDFTSDGTIFIHQTERSEAYELSQANGASYVVWVYSSDKSDKASQSQEVMSQIQSEYIWNKDEYKYVKNRELKITGSRIAAKELERIQKNVETFSSYLDGLWYRANNTGTTPLYIYFNSDDKEVIFLSDDTEGVYTWEASNLRRSGIYLTTSNAIIPSMKRRFDIMLTGVNEVYVNVHDDVRMIIKETNQWSGTYKKMSFNTSFENKNNLNPIDEYSKILVSSVWDTGDGTFSFKDNEYFYTSELFTESGLYITDFASNFPVIQFKSYSESSVLNSAYVMHFDEVKIQEKPKKRNQKPVVKTVVNKDIIHFSPVTLSPVTCYASEGRILTLSKKTNIDNN